MSNATILLSGYCSVPSSLSLSKRKIMKRPAASSSLPTHTLSSRLHSNSNEPIRGGAQAVEEGYEYYEDGDDGAYEDDEDYYIVGDDYVEDGGEDGYYEYYPDVNYDEEEVMEEDADGYYSDEVYVDGVEEGETEDDGYFYLQDINEDGDESTSTSKRYNFLPSNLPRATLSISGVPSAIPQAMSRLSMLPSTLKAFNWQGAIVGGGGPVSTVAVLSIVMLAVVRRAFISRSQKREGELLSTEEGNVENQKDVESNDDDEALATPEKYGDFSSAFVDAVRDMEKEDDDDEDTMDLDSDEYNKSGRVRKQSRIARGLSHASSSTATLASNLWSIIRGRNGVSSQGGPSSQPSEAINESIVVDIDEALANDTNDHEPIGDPSVDKSDYDEEVDITTPSSSSLSSKDIKRLKQDLEKMSESRQSLEKEYEASLRMLHDARMEVQKMKRVVKTAMDSSAREEEEQREKMDAMVKKLDMKYKSQMKEQIEKLRSKMESKLRTDVQLEMQERMEFQLKERFVEQDEQVEDKVQQRVVQERIRLKDDLNRKFKQEVEDAVASEIDSAVDHAVGEAVQRERQKAREEMIRVRQGIQKVLERERKLMREQVRRATGQVREWVVKKQQDQLLQQAGQLQEEAEKLQGLARSRAGGRGGREGATSNFASSPRRGARSTSRDEYTDRYDDTDDEYGS